MKKIGLVTLYNYNYGSALQAYASQHVLRSFGYDCVLFCRREKGIMHLLQKASYLGRAAGMMVLHPLQARSFLRLLQSTRRTSHQALGEEGFKGLEAFVNDDLRRAEYSYRHMCREARKEEYIAFFSGSDQVWNGDWFVRDSLYFLRFAPKQKRIGWAASFGTGRIADYNRRRFKKDLAAYRLLSTREKEGVRLIQDVCGCQAKQLPDPVILLTAEEWRSLYEAKTTYQTRSPYVFVYFCSQPSQAALNHLHALKDQKLRFVAFASEFDNLKQLNDVEFVSGYPWVFLRLLDESQCVVTDSLHALLFASIFHKRVRIFRRCYAHDSDQSARIVSFLEEYGISQCLTMEANGIFPEVDDEAVDLLLKQNRERAHDFLNDVFSLEGIR